jgi:hypothetical protein
MIKEVLRVSLRPPEQPDPSVTVAVMDTVPMDPVGVPLTLAVLTLLL